MSSCSTCFNGAVVFQRRRFAGSAVPVPGTKALQWGRRLSTTEIRKRGVHARRIAAASMGPSSFNDGDACPSPSLARPPNSFNGAVVFQRRRSHVSIRRDDQVRIASMGPSSFNDGDKTFDGGRAYTVRASMGPSSFNDGDSTGSRRGRWRYHRFNGAVVFQRRRFDLIQSAAPSAPAASMGPSSFNDGD